MSIPSTDLSFEAAFKKLTMFLSISLQSETIIRIPAAVLEPFHSTANPVDSKLLRPLAKLFDGKRQDNALKLAPRSFYSIFMIVLCFPYSRIQERCLYTFLNAITVYKDEDKASTTLSRFTEEPIEPTAVSAGRSFICQRLTHHVAAILQHPNTRARKKRFAAEIITKLLLSDIGAASKFISQGTSQFICDIVCNHADYVLRLLVTDICREIIHQKATRFGALFKGCPEQILEKHFTFSKAHSQWLGGIFDTLSKADAAHLASQGQDQVFRLRSIEFEDGIYDDENENILVVIADVLTFILPANLDSTLSIIEIPFVAGMKAVVAEIDDDNRRDNTAVVKVDLPSGNGDRYFRGTRKAILSFRMTLTQEVDAKKLVDCLRQSAVGLAVHQSDGISSVDTIQITDEPRQALTFAPISWHSDDDAWIHRYQDEQEVDDEDARPDLEESVESSPALVENMIEVEEAVAQSIFQSSSMHGQTTKLYEKMKSSQQINTVGHGLTKRTPLVAESDDHVTASERLEFESPLIRLSQNPSARRSNKEGTTQIVSADRLSTNTTALERKRKELHNEAHDPGKLLDLPAQSAAIALRTQKPEVKPTIHAMKPAKKRKTGLIDTIDSAELTTQSIEQVPAPTETSQAMARLAETQGLHSSSSLKPLSGRKNSVVRQKLKATENAGADWNEDLRLENGTEDGTNPKKRRGKVAKVKALQNPHKPVPKSKQQTTKRVETVIRYAKGSEQSEVGADSRTIASMRGRRNLTAKPTNYVESSSDDEAEERLHSEGESGHTELKSILNIEACGRDLQDNPQTPTPTQTQQGRDRQFMPSKPISPGSVTSSSNGFIPVPIPNSLASQREAADREPQSIVEEPASPSSRRTQKRTASTTEENTAIVHDEDEHLAKDSFSLEIHDGSALAASNASFAAKLSQMVHVGTLNTNATTPRTPFGNPRVFIANVNAARKVSPSKLVKKPHRKKTADSYKHVYKLQKVNESLKQQDNNQQEAEKATIDHSLMARSESAPVSSPVDADGTDEIPDVTTPSAPLAFAENMEAASQDTIITDHIQLSSILPITDPIVRSKMRAKPSKLRQQLPNQKISHTNDTLVRGRANDAHSNNTRRSETQPVLQIEPSEQHRKSRSIESSPYRAIFADPKVVGDRQYQLRQRGVQTQSGIPDVSLNLRSPLAGLIQTQKKVSTMNNSLDLAKPQIVHFSKVGPVNQGKCLNNVSARKSLPAVMETEKSKIPSSKVNPRSEPVMQMGHISMNQHETREETGSNKFQDDEGILELPEADEAHHEVSLLPIEERDSMSHLPRETATIKTAINTKLKRAQALDLVNLPYGTKSKEVENIDPSSRNVNQPHVLLKNRLSLQSDLQEQREHRESEAVEELKLPLTKDYRPKVCLHPVKSHSSTVVAARSSRGGPDYSRFERSSIGLSGVLPNIPSKVDLSKHKRVVAVNQSIPILAGTMVPPATKLFTANPDIFSSKLKPITAVACKDNSERFVTILKSDIERMPPPPRLQVTKLDVEMMDRTTDVQAKSTEVQKEGSAGKAIKHTLNNELMAFPMPKRSKPHRLSKTEDKVLPVTSTPISFSTTMAKVKKEVNKNLHAASSRQANSVIKSQDNDATLLSAANTDKQSVTRKLFTNKIICQEESSSSESEPDFEGTPISKHRSHAAATDVDVNDHHNDLRRTLGGLVEIVIDRFQTEESTVRSQVSLFNCRAGVLLNRVHLSWDDNLKYEKDELVKKLEEEQDALSSVTATLKTTDETLKEREISTDTTERIEEKKLGLLKLLQQIPF